MPADPRTSGAEPRVVEGDGTYSVRIQGLAKSFDGVEAVSDLWLDVRRGEFLGFLGPNGAGKTTTIKLLSGLMRPTRGRMEVAGIDVRRDPVGVKRRIGILPEEIETFDRLTGLELLVFTGRMHGLPHSEAHRRAIDLLDLVGLEEADRERLLIDYSMGMKKKVTLAAALIHGPEVLFLDEPFNGIDVVSVHALRGVLQKLAESGVTIFFSSHVMEVVEKLSTSVAIIDRGRLKVKGTLPEARRALGLAEDASLETLFLEAIGHGGRHVALDWLQREPHDAGEEESGAREEE